MKFSFKIIKWWIISTRSALTMSHYKFLLLTKITQSLFYVQEFGEREKKIAFKMN